MAKTEQIKVSQMLEIVKKNMKLPDRIYFFDTTLRDGEQTPGISFTLKEKQIIAQALSDEGIDIIEAGFPIISEGDFEACKTIASMGLKSEVIGLARLVKKDIDAVVDARMDSIHVFIATSDIHLKNKLNMTRAEVLERITEMVGYARKHFDIVEFSAEDATRTDLDFLIKANLTAIKAGATRINIPDTVGTISPTAYGYIIRKNREAFDAEGYNDVRISVHCHNDFGLAVANSIAGVENGAAQVQTTIMGIGERAGNASFEQTAMALYAFYQIPMNINTRKIYPTAKLVESFCGPKFRIPMLAPLIGRNAFRHESGIHTHAMMQNARTYEPITPELLGISRSDDLADILNKSFNFGKHTGTHALRAKLKEMGFDLSDEQIRKIMKRVKELGDRGHQVQEEDLMAIVRDELGVIENEEKYIDLEQLIVLTGSVIPTATVKLKMRSSPDEEFKSEIHSETGVGPIDAAYNAILRPIQRNEPIKLISYNIDAVTGGSDALGRVYITLSNGKHVVDASATSQDIVGASVQALINGINKIMRLQDKIGVK